MNSLYDPNFAPTAALSVLVTASVATSASAIAAGLGPFRGLYFNTSTSITVTQMDGTTVAYNNVSKSVVLWVAGKFVSAIATATAVYALK